VIPVSAQVPAAIVLVLGGIVACFFGYRLFRIVLGIYGFILGALIATTVSGSASTGTLVLTAIVGGVIGAVVLNLAYFLGVVLVGAALGAMAVTLIFGRGGSGPHVLLVILFAVIGAVAAMMLQRYVIVTATAFGGAWTALVGGLALAGDRAAKAAAAARDVWVVYPLDPAPGRRWVLWAWLGLGLAGLLTQLAQGRRAAPARAVRAKKR